MNLTQKKWAYNFKIGDRVSFLDFDNWNIPKNQRTLKRFYGTVIKVRDRFQHYISGATVRPDISIVIGPLTQTEFTSRKLDLDLVES